ncbi:cysteine hydrolase family protein [Pseudomonas helleri]|uniref:cysteine hydrolase family protein n=1 Tax=Pseudomonas helleri TaxID=1608996 RepID=UPI003F992BEB
MNLDSLQEWLAPARTALCIIDPQVDFIAPHGLLANLGVDVAPLAAPLGRIQRLLEQARASGVAVYFIGLAQSVEGCPPSWQQRLLRSDKDLQVANSLCVELSPGAEFFGVQPHEGEQVVWKHRYSAFHGTDLATRLRATGIDTLAVCGFTTECCVDSTVRDAFHQDFAVFVASDACAAYDPQIHRHSLAVLAESFAINLETDALIQAWSHDHA